MLRTENGNEVLEKTAFAVIYDLIQLVLLVGGVRRVGRVWTLVKAN